MQSLMKMVFPDRGGRPPEVDGGNYSRSDRALKLRPKEAQKISKHPVIRILLRIDELHHRDEAGHGVKQNAEDTLAQLEACLAAIHKSAS